MAISSFRVVPAVAALVCAPLALAGPDWDKDLEKDAGSSIVTAQLVTFQGNLSTIAGKLSGTADGPGDYQDVYQIYISDPGTFLISLAAQDGGSLNFDAALWLFGADGRALLGTNDSSAKSNAPIMGNQSNAGPSVTITTPGIYYLAVSGFQSMPTWFGVPCFPSIVWDPGVVAGGVTYGWDGDWDGNGDTGDYVMSVEGVAGVPAPGAIALLGLLPFTSSSRQRRRR